MSEEVVTVFRLVGRKEPKNPGVGEGQTRFDLLIQPLMVREGSDALPISRGPRDESRAAVSTELRHKSRD